MCRKPCGQSNHPRLAGEAGGVGEAGEAGEAGGVGEAGEAKIGLIRTVLAH